MVLSMQLFCFPVVKPASSLSQGLSQIFDPPMNHHHHQITLCFWLPVRTPPGLVLELVNHSQCSLSLCLQPPTPIDYSLMKIPQNYNLPHYRFPMQGKNYISVPGEAFTMQCEFPYIPFHSFSTNIQYIYILTLSK